MHFFARVPRFKATVYEKAIQLKLQDEAVLNDKYRHLALLELQKHARKIASSMHQLRGTLKHLSIYQLDNQLQAAILDAVEKPDFNYSFHKGMEYPLDKLKEVLLSNRKARKISGISYLLLDSLVFAAGVVGIVQCSILAVATFPLGVAFLGLGLAVLNALIVGLAAYRIYAGVRNLQDSPIKEIEEGIKFLENYADYPAFLQKQKRENCIYVVEDQQAASPGYGTA